MTTAEIISTIVVAMVGSSALFTFLQFLISRKDTKAKKMDEIASAIAELQKTIKSLQQISEDNNTELALQKEALMAIAQDRILYLGKIYIKQGYIYEDDLKSVRRMADAYRDMDGNGDVKIIMELVDKLPIKIKER